jgi:hypothetical protein
VRFSAKPGKDEANYQGDQARDSGSGSRYGTPPAVDVEGA